ncbi:hypothetical protein D3C87_1995000 [compost metagenome]
MRHLLDDGFRIVHQQGEDEVGALAPQRAEDRQGMDDAVGSDAQAPALDLSALQDGIGLADRREEP